MRAFVERLFENLKDKAKEGEYTIYCLYMPKEDADVEELELMDFKVCLSDAESVKKFLDRATKETLEMEVKGFYLLGMVLDKGGEYVISSEDPKAEELKDQIINKIESLKEE